jgi:hypothetical protein
MNSSPQFSWSHARDRTYSECPRRAYYTYYGSHEGWLRDALPAVQRAYRLKKLTSLSMLLGQEIHARAREITEIVRAGGALPTLHDTIDRTRDGMNRVWRSSKDRGAFERRPSRHPMLIEVYKGLPAAERFATLRGRIQLLSENLLHWPGWDEIAACGRDGVHLFDAIDPIDHGGHALYAAPDLAYGTDGDALTIQDWKCGGEDGVEAQLGVYAVYLRARGLGPHFKGRVVNLLTPHDRDVSLTEAVLEGAVRRIRDSTWDMRRYLEDMDVKRNVALPVITFPQEPAEDKCRWCLFEELCLEDPQHAVAVGPF